MPNSVEDQVLKFEKIINKCLRNGVRQSIRPLKKRVKEINTTAVNRLVYAKYEPILYVRRKTNGGLSDPHNVTFGDAIVEGDGVAVNCKLRFNNIAKVNFKNVENLKKSKFYKKYNDYYLASMIEEGYGNKNTPYSEARPFIDVENGQPEYTNKNNGIKQRATLLAQILVDDYCVNELKKTFGNNGVRRIYNY